MILKAFFLHVIPSFYELPVETYNKFYYTQAKTSESVYFLLYFPGKKKFSARENMCKAIIAQKHNFKLIFNYVKGLLHKKECVETVEYLIHNQIHVKLVLF